MRFRAIYHLRAKPHYPHSLRDCRRRLVEEQQAGNRAPDEFVRELTRSQNRLYGFVRCLLFDPKDVEDVLQDVNVVLLRKHEEFEIGTNFWAWASTVARFQVLTYCKRLGRDRLVFDDSLLELIASDVGEMSGEIDDRMEVLQGCMEKLPTPQRQLLSMRYEPDSSLSVIAESLDRTVGSVRQALFRIRESLLGCVQQNLKTS
ncbi:sigma-70 family RNA polymerase sigma factor [Aporhodopirellula aestuarii]|uniref:Sigma-70 family RNA polymerase sigma factor n=1 Tax=Aporhodopirellula aestuarii TaxID=2950107 RepID=A0ABT0TZK0_9BACT|nr:sigma-70 family RNA polymerase sigma factor [Aporhodopirellula aestuarii]MCM2369981.1 sigma-70 family RNA polymerase sigma factor [Aporhodopirellula aestuarii]